MFMSATEEIKNERKFSGVEKVDTEGDQKKETNLEAQLMVCLEEEAREPSPVHSMNMFMSYDYKNQLQLTNKDTNEFGSQVDLLEEVAFVRSIPKLIHSTCIQLDIMKKYKRVEREVNTEQIKLLVTQVFQFSIESKKSNIKLANIINKLQTINIINPPKPVIHKEVKQEEPTTKKTLTESAHSMVRKKPLSKFDPLKSFFVLVVLFNVVDYTIDNNK